MYGWIGAEAARGMPYYVWRVLPRVFGELLPGPGEQPLSIVDLAQLTGLGEGAAR